ncbi:MAG: Bifunctional protein: zinc-containing alcohol dehydrogenase [Pedosphaera sp.]|nr:Bifunctional protein: zinc-containing alcohol dehydrogenase [Pedosphaera sp.]
MKTAAIDRFGPPSVIKLRLLPVPEPGPREVLIALHAAGVGVWDADIRAGWWPQGRPKFPLVLGSDGAGTVAAKGALVRRFNVGDKVWAYEFINPKGGFYAEYVAVNAEHVGRVPRRLDLLQAGAAAVTGLTALQGIDDHLRVCKGETVLIFGATGAVGTLAVQFAKWRGARVLATASGRAATELVKRLGAKGVFDPRSPRAIEQLRALAPDGIDAVLALAGGKTLEGCLDLVSPGGRVAYPHGVEPEPKRRPKVRVIAYDGEASVLASARLERAVDEARLRVPIAAVYPLAQAAKAHERLKKGQVLGRIALKIR